MKINEHLTKCVAALDPAAVADDVESAKTLCEKEKKQKKKIRRSVVAMGACAIHIRIRNKLKFRRAAE